MPPKFRSLLRQNLSQSVVSDDINQKQAADQSRAVEDDEMVFENVIEASPSLPRLDVMKDGTQKIVNTHDNVNDFMHDIYLRMGNGEYFVENAYIDTMQLFAQVNITDHLLHVRMRVYSDVQRTKQIYEDTSQYTSLLCREIIQMDTPLKVYRLKPLDDLPRVFLQAQLPVEQQAKLDAIFQLDQQKQQQQQKEQQNTKAPLVSGVLKKILQNEHTSNSDSTIGKYLHSNNHSNTKRTLTPEQEDVLQKEIQSLGLGILSHIKFKDEYGKSTSSQGKKNDLFNLSNAESLVDSGIGLKEGQLNKTLGTQRMQTLPSVKYEEKMGVSLSSKKEESKVKLTIPHTTTINITNNTNTSSHTTGNSTILPKSMFKSKFLVQTSNTDQDTTSIDEDTHKHEEMVYSAVRALPPPTSIYSHLQTFIDHIHGFLTLSSVASYRLQKRKQAELHAPMAVHLSWLDMYQGDNILTPAVPYKYMKTQYTTLFKKPTTVAPKLLCNLLKKIK